MKGGTRFGHCCAVRSYTFARSCERESRKRDGSERAKGVAPAEEARSGHREVKATRDLRSAEAGRYRRSRDKRDALRMVERL